MKQYITRHQFDELSDIQKQRWITWALYHDGAVMPSVQQMIQFLDVSGKIYPASPADVLCDDLWDKVKATL